MIKDLLVSFKDNIKAKTTNPFFGTLIVVWLIHNYKFVYTIFNFRQSTGLDDRLTFIGTYLDSDKFLPNLFWCIGYAILVLVATYLLLNLSRLIVYTFDKKVTPWIKKITDSDSVVDKDVHEILKQENLRLVNRVDQEREGKLHVQAENETLETKITTQLSKIKELEDSIEEKKEADKKNLEDIADIVNEARQNSEIDFKSMPTPVKSDPFEGVDKEKIETLLKDDKLIKVFNEVTIAILKKKNLSDSEYYNQLVLLDVIEVVKREYQFVTFGFTTNGRYLRKLLLDKEDNKSRKLFKDE